MGLLQFFVTVRGPRLLPPMPLLRPPDRYTKDNVDIWMSTMWYKPKASSHERKRVFTAFVINMCMTSPREIISGSRHIPWVDVWVRALGACSSTWRWLGFIACVRLFLCVCGWVFVFVLYSSSLIIFSTSLLPTNLKYIHRQHDSHSPCEGRRR